MSERAVGSHRWSLGWPGNHCLDCGADDGIELAISCGACYLPCCDEEMAADPAVRLCPEHRAIVDTPCPSSP